MEAEKKAKEAKERED
jgi:hypothetical protein